MVKAWGCGAAHTALHPNPNHIVVAFVPKHDASPNPDISYSENNLNFKFSSYTNLATVS